MGTKDAQEFVNNVYEYAADLMFKQKKSVMETKKVLMEQGLTAENADLVISNLQLEMAKIKNKAARKNMIYGAIWCIAGLLVTIISYSVASGGGKYVLAWGAILFGAIQFLKGLFQKFS